MKVNSLFPHRHHVNRAVCSNDQLYVIVSSSIHCESILPVKYLDVGKRFESSKKFLQLTKREAIQHARTMKER